MKRYVIQNKRKLCYVFRVLFFLIILVLLIRAANFCLYNDNTYTRVMFHEMYDSEPIDAAFVGSSIVYRHFDPEIWDAQLGMHTFNLGTSSQTPDDTYYILKELFKKQKPKYCIYGINSISFLKLDGYNNPTKSYIIFDYLKPSVNKYEYGNTAFARHSLLNAWIPATRSANKSLIKTIRDTVKVKRTEAYRTYSYKIYEASQEEYRGRGFVYTDRQTEKGAVGRVGGYLFCEYELSEEYIFYMKKIKELCDANRCELILIVPPLPYGSMAAQKDYQEILDLYADVADSLDAPLFNFDLVRPDYLAMEDSDFYDSGHMSGKGARRFSEAASKLIKRYIDGEAIDRDAYFYSSYNDLLDASPWIFNTWLVKTEDGYTAEAAYGNGVLPEFAFYWSQDMGETWNMIKTYSQDCRIAGEEIPAGGDMIMVRTRPGGTLTPEGEDGGQCDRMVMK